MLTSSRKAKGRKAQQIVRDLLLELNPELTADDVSSRSMGASGTDILLSAAAKKLVPLKIEVKNQERLKSIFALYDQAISHEGPEEPVVVLKMNRRQPLALVDIRYFLQLIRNKNATE